MSRIPKDLSTLTDEEVLILYDILSAQYNQLDPKRKKFKAKVGSRLFKALDEIAKRNIWFKEH